MTKILQRLVSPGPEAQLSRQRRCACQGGVCEEVYVKRLVVTDVLDRAIRACTAGTCLSE